MYSLETQSFSPLSLIEVCLDPGKQTSQSSKAQLKLINNYGVEWRAVLVFPSLLGLDLVTTFLRSVCACLHSQYNRVDGLSQ